ncbi:MAG TPA: carboxymuconolactone decarboxylase family protein [Burkholderiaceae bacterium]|jgi:4-carboxymuconolactone decarboxylase|nr:carboxymuconolactone decarboxylase family protein [Burkholderiaceae bacterium]
MKPSSIAVLLTTLACAACALAQDRLPTIAAEKYTDEQKKAAEDFKAARGVPVFGPFEPMMHSPRLMNQARAMGDYLRFNSAIGNVLSELAILVAAREWSQDYEWAVHAPIALRAGIKPEVIDAIADGRRPNVMTEDEQTVYDFLTELNRNRRVSDATFDRADRRFGKKGVVDLTGINGYYTLLAMQLNVARTPMPKDGRSLPRFPQ